MHKIKRRFFTLIEMMVVIAILGAIIAVISINVAGNLEKSKADTTGFAMDNLENQLELMIANDPSLENDIDSRWKDLIKDNKMIKNSNKLIYDGWGKEFQVRFESGRVEVKSAKYEEFLQKNPNYPSNRRIQ